MLPQLVHWTEIAVTVVEALVLVRLLTLRLQNAYPYIALYWLVNLIFDVARWSVGWDSRPAERLDIYSWFLFGIVIPLACWDVFAEMPAQVKPLKRIQLTRMIAAMVGAFLFAGISVATMSDDAAAAENTLPALMGMFVVVGASLAGLLFVFTVGRTSRLQHVIAPANTRTWSIYFLFGNSVLLLSFALAFGREAIGMSALQMLEVVLAVADIGVSIWVLSRLQKVTGPKGEDKAKPVTQ